MEWYKKISKVGVVFAVTYLLIAVVLFTYGLNCGPGVCALFMISAGAPWFFILGLLNTNSDFVTPIVIISPILNILTFYYVGSLFDHQSSQEYERQSGRKSILSVTILVIVLGIAGYFLWSQWLSSPTQKFSQPVRPTLVSPPQ